MAAKPALISPVKHIFNEFKKKKILDYRNAKNGDDV